MSTVSALILVGHGHPNDAGNRSFAQVSLEEGDRPALLLHWTHRPRAVDGEFFRTFTMIPTPEHMLHDSILIVAYAVCRHPLVFSEEVACAPEILTMQKRYMSAPCAHWYLFTDPGEVKDLVKFAEGLPDTQEFDKKLHQEMDTKPSAKRVSR